MAKSIGFLAIFAWIYSLVPFQRVSNIDFCPNCNMQEQKQEADQIDVRISPLKDTIVSGDTLPLRVEIWNIGNQDVFVCKNFRGAAVALCNLTISFNPVRGGSRTLAAADALPSEKKESFVNALINNWISIPPKHFYGEIVDLNPSSYPELATVGRYRITGRYVSGGLLTSATYNSLRLYPQEVAQLPTRSWQGSVDTNAAMIRVVPST